MLIGKNVFKTISIGALLLICTIETPSALAQRTKIIGTTSNEGIIDIAVNKNWGTQVNNVYAAGFSGGPIDGQGNSGGLDVLLTKFDENYNKEWT